MNYDAFINATYFIEDNQEQNGDILLLTSSSQYYIGQFSNNQPYTPFIDLIGYVDSYYHNNYSNSGDFVGFVYRDKDGNSHLILTTYVDVVVFNNSSNVGSQHLTMANYLSSNGYYPLEDGGDALTNYYTHDGDTDINYEVNQLEQYSLTLSPRHYSAYNFMNTSSGKNYKQNSYAIDSNYGIYYHCFNLGNSNLDTLEISYCDIYHSTYKEGESVGYNSGYRQGYDTGKQDGFELGQITAGVDQNTHNAFAYIAEGFGVVENIIGIEVLPNITLGLCVSIPLVLTVIAVIIKMAKK